MTEDRDALDLLKNLAGGVDPEKCSPFQAMAREFALEAIAAWEKERAEAERALSVARTLENNERALARSTLAREAALHAALEKIEGELRNRAELAATSEHAEMWLEVADALRALHNGEGT